MIDKILNTFCAVCKKSKNNTCFNCKVVVLRNALEMYWQRKADFQTCAKLSFRGKNEQDDKRPS